MARSVNGQNEPRSGEVLPPGDQPDPNLDDLGWLRSVRNNTRMPWPVRIDAAKASLAYNHPRLAQVNQEVTSGITIKIEGGLPALPGTNIIMPGAVPNPSSVASSDRDPPQANGEDS